MPGHQYVVGKNLAMHVSILDGVLQSYGLQQMECSTSEIAVVQDDMAFEVYPVPADESLQVECTPGTMLTLFDMVGREALACRASVAMTTLEVRELAEGNYILRASSEGRVTTRKVVIRH